MYGAFFVPLIILLTFAIATLERLGASQFHHD